ncbi:MAG TPA: anaerobic ribonucleoside-triphosphate reductase activating protein [bacterium]|nr:anaerobic ribonucleoside-triphosphate reductase activating protein [bacterium]
MVIGGLEKLSLIDFPGYISAVVFTNSCNFRCHFCYNPMLVLTNGGESEYKKEEDFSQMTEEDLLLFLKSRIGKLEGVVISGGEPTLQPDLKDFIIKIKNLGFKIKLDTNGTNSKLLADLIYKKLIDYVAMDIKAPFSKYEKVVGVKVNLKEIKKSIDLLMTGKFPYEFRTTLVPGLHTLDDVVQMSKEISGAKKWFLQKFKSDTDLVNSDFKNKQAFTTEEVMKMIALAKKNVSSCKLRD